MVEAIQHDVKLLDTVPREVGQKRFWVDKQGDLFKWLNNNRRYNDCNISVYRFAERRGETFYGDAVYESAVIDKVFIDTDSFYGWEAMKILNWKLNDLGVLHRVNASGRWVHYGCVKRAIGFHIYIFTYPNLRYPKMALTNYQDFLNDWLRQEIEKEFHVKALMPIDEAIIGDTARMSRYPNTHNKKWGRWCIPLTQFQIDEMSPYDIHKLSRRSQFDGEFWLGDSLYEIPNKFDKPRLDRQYVVHDVASVEIADLPYKLPPCLQNMMGNSTLDYQERFWFILCMRVTGFTEEETTNLLESFLDPDYFYHCTETGGEDMVRRVYRGRQASAYFRDGCAWMRRRGYCSGCKRRHPVYL